MKEENNRGNIDYSLEWKKHDDFFTSLNKKLDEISDIGEKCYGNLNNLFAFVWSL